MCLILFSYRQHPRYPLIVAANRDEFYSRPTDPLDFWDEHPEILAGRDGQSHGTWMGVNRRGRFAAVTNFRAPAHANPQAPSRGHLVSRFLISDQDPGEYLASLRGQARQYNGFNLLAGDIHHLFYYSNVGQGIHEVQPGVHGLSNAFLNTPWPKVETSRRAFNACVGRDDISVEDLFGLLTDSDLPPDDQLPDTGVGLTWERLLAPVFVESRTYGTRSSAVILMETSGAVHYWERTYARDASGMTSHETRSFVF